MSGGSQSSGVVANPFVVPFAINFAIACLDISVAAEALRSQG